MKTAPGSLISLLNSSNTFLMADLYKVTLFSGASYYWTSADQSILYASANYLSPTEGGTNVPLVRRGPTRAIAGLEVDELEITLSQGGGQVLFGTIPLSQAAMNGAFDGATIVVTRVFMTTWGDTTPGGVVLFSGAVASVEPTSTSVKLTLKSDLDKLLVAMPRNLFTPACSHTLFDSGCGLTRASFAVTGHVTGAPTPTTTAFGTDLLYADQYFQLGVIVMLSGPASGSRAAVRSFLSGVVTLSVVFPVAPAVGDFFSIIPGCDKTQTTCDAKFANLTRFRGFPSIPKPESAR